MKEQTTIDSARTVYLSLGGNLGDVATLFSQAIERIEALASVSKLVRASVWKTAAVGLVTDQPAFLNTGVRVHVNGDEPVTLLARLRAIETDLGRQRTQVGGPRSIDIDVLMWGQRMCTLPGPPKIILPHPRLCQRAFALAPLVELGGADLRIPGNDMGAGELLEKARRDPAQTIERTAILL